MLIHHQLPAHGSVHIFQLVQVVYFGLRCGPLHIVAIVVVAQCGIHTHRGFERAIHLLVLFIHLIRVVVHQVSGKEDNVCLLVHHPLYTMRYCTMVIKATCMYIRYLHDLHPLKSIWQSCQLQLYLAHPVLIPVTDAVAKAQYRQAAQHQRCALQKYRSCYAAILWRSSICRIVVCYRRYGPGDQPAYIIYQHHQQYQHFAYYKAQHKCDVHIAQQVRHIGPVDLPEQYQPQPAHYRQRKV